MLKNMRITAKLILSSVVFLAPVAVMLYLVVSVSIVPVQTARKEQRGIACLKPAAGILRAVSALALNYPSGDSSRLNDVHLNDDPLNNDHLNNDQLNNEVSGLFDALERELGKSSDFPTVSENQERRKIDGGAYPSVPALRAMLMKMNDGDLEGKPESYTEIIRNIGELIIYISDSSGLSSDPGLDNHFLVTAGIKSLPGTLARFIQTGNTVRTASFRPGFPETAKKDIEACLILLKEVDYPESLYNLKTAEQKLADSLTGGTESIGAEEILSELENYRSSVEELIAVLETAAVSSDPGLYNSPIFEKLNNASGSAFSLQDASINRIENTLHDRINNGLVKLIRAILIALLAAVPAFVIVIMINVSIFRSTARFGRLFKSLHNNDLSLTFKVESRDEFGEMMSAFNRFLEKLRAAFASFSQSASMVSTAVYDLSASAKEISTTANEQSTSVAEIVSTIEDNTNLSGQISLKTGEVVNLMTKTRELSQRGAELWEINQDMMLDIRNQNAKIVEEIMNLADMINHIDEIISIIDVIANQTKLIAFNASLEASSSGEEGARFAVVAGEIRRFADGVAESTAEIKEKIEEIQSASRKVIEEANEGSLQIDEGYERMAEQKTVFENILNVSQNTAASSQQISNLSRQQEFASSQIFQALKEISAGVKQFVIATTSTSKIADNLNLMSVELRETVDKYRTGRIDGKETGGESNGN